MKTISISLLSLHFFLAALASAQWIPQTSPLPINDTTSDVPGKIQFVSPTEGWIGMSSARLLHTVDAGANWVVVDPDPVDTAGFFSNPTGSISFTDSQHGWAIGTLYNSGGAVLYKTVNGGSSWNRQVLTPWIWGAGVQFLDSSIGWIGVIGANFATAAILRTVDGGVNWIPGQTFSQKIVKPFFVDANNGWAYTDSITNNISSPSEILHTTDGGANWTTQLRVTTPGELLDIHFSDLNHGWVTGRNDKVYKTNNGGANWTRVTNMGQDATAKHSAVFFVDSNNGWISGKIPGNGNNAVLHTTNGGTSWTIDLSNTQYDVFSLFFVDANSGWLAADYGAIAHYTSGVGIFGKGPNHFTNRQTRNRVELRNLNGRRYSAENKINFDKIIGWPSP